tara:strand:- start:1976 stop:2617 length:642 start_codon:yes stop_codon:yes gene_type:complete
MTGIYANSIKDKTGTRQLASDSGSAWSWGSGVPAGTIIQTQFTQLTTSDQQNYSADANTIVSGMTVNITPLFNNSIIKLESYLFCEFENVNEANGSVSFFFRDSTALGNTQSSPSERQVGISSCAISYWASDPGMSTAEGFTTTFFDRPNDGTNSISQITYKLGIQGANGGDLYINRTGADTDAGYIERGCSYISATEIAQSSNGTITPAKAS